MSALLKERRFGGTEMNYQTRALTLASVSFLGSSFTLLIIDNEPGLIDNHCFAQYLETSCAVKILNICVFYDVITPAQKLTTVL